MHTLDLPKKNLTPDGEVIARAKQDGRVVVSKDIDFVLSFLIADEPSLLLISTGNIIESANKQITNPFAMSLSKGCVVRQALMKQLSID